MTHTAYTAELSGDWDIQLDENGNVSMLRSGAAVVQNVCNEGRLFRHDAVFRWEDGIEWFDDQIALPVRQAVVIADLRGAAERVPGVLTVRSVDLKTIDPETRTLHAEMEITTEGGTNGRAQI